MVVYGSRQAAPARVAPLDPHDVMPITLDVDQWLRGEALASHVWTPTGALKVGDGVLTKTLGGGNVVTPMAPLEFVDPEDQRRKIMGFVFIEDGVEFDLYSDVIVTVHLETATPRGADKSIIMEIREG